MVLYLISLFLPTNTKVTHTELIHGEIDDVYEQFYDVSNWKNWCVWNNEEQKSLLIYDENSRGTGASFRWKHGKKYNSNGKIEIINVHKNKSIEFYIKASSIDSIFTYVHLNRTPKGIEVEWMSDLELNNSGSRLMGYFLRRWLLRDIKKSLRNINQYLIEKNMYAGWVSDGYSIQESEKVFTITKIDTVNNDDFILELEENYKYLNDQAENELDTETDVFFYKKVSSITNSKGVYKFYLTLKNNEIVAENVEEMSGKYLIFKYLGFNKGVKKGIDKGKSIAKKEQIKIDPNPYISFNEFPLNLQQIDTNSMAISFSIH